MVNGSYQGLSLCDGCVQNMSGRRFVTTDGQGSSGILILGESPWLDEVRMGKPFQGAAGALLDSQLRRAGLDRSNVIISNVMWCSPPWLDWVGKHPDSWIALRQCQPYWERLIELLKPKVIVTLGAVAMRQVLECSDLDARQSYVHDSKYGCPVIPSYHPAYIIRGNQKLTQALFFAIMRAKEVAAAGGQWVREPVEYIVDPPVNVARDYIFDGAAASSVSESADSLEQALAKVSSRDIKNSRVMQWATEPADRAAARWRGAGYPSIPLLIEDIETPNSSKLDEEEREEKDPSFTIVRFGFSVKWGTAVSMPWQEPYISLGKEALQAAAVVSFHNTDGFELPRLIYNGCQFRGEIHDTMWMWHWLQSDMLKSLGFISPFFTDMPAWKHLSDSDPGFYNACDNDAQFRCYIGIRRALEQAGRWQRFVKHCIRLDEIFRRDHVGRIPVAKQAQQELAVKLRAERDAALEQLQSQVPDSVRNHKVYKTSKAFDADSDKQHWQIEQKPCPKCQGRDEQQVPVDVEVQL